MDMVRVNSCVQDRVHGRVLGPGAVYTYIHGPNTKDIQLATFSQIVVITSVIKGKHNIACYRKFIIYGVNMESGHT